MPTIYDQKYKRLVDHLVRVRKTQNITQESLAESLGWDQSSISKVENFDRRIDVIELYEWLKTLEYDFKDFLQEVGLIDSVIDTNSPALPLPGKAVAHHVGGVPGTNIELSWQGQKKQVFIENLPVGGYLTLEDQISNLYKSLNDGKGGKNREAIFKALSLAIDSFPDVNPSDIYHHLVYRIYLRDYTKTQADRSWVRAGGEAFEFFIESHYNEILRSHGIRMTWLKSDPLKKAALEEMGIANEVGGSKLDIALYGNYKGKQFVFGGVHAKASLAERVSDDVPCSVKMMQKGYVSYLLTLDAKSYPPPTGDLVNRGELGSPSDPSDKRKYVEEHGDFSACFSYNLRTVASPGTTRSGRKIFVSTFDPQKDPLIPTVVAAWAEFCSRL